MPMPSGKTVLVIPPNDPEAVMIFELSKRMGLPAIESRQPHGATLDRERGLIQKIKRGGWKRAVVVEMPGERTEAKLRRVGIELVLIDHHHYRDLDRAHDPKTRRLLPSSLEQFRRLFRLTDNKIRCLGFEPLLVRGIGIMDRAFVWGLREEGFSERDIRRVLAFQSELTGPLLDPKAEARKERQARKAWKSRKSWKGYTIVVDDSLSELRPRISRIIALEVGRPLPLILVERRRGLVYVQESDRAMYLFKKFGGFTFGMDRNWGYKNERGRPRVSLEAVLEALGA